MLDINKLEERHQKLLRLISTEKSNRSLLFEFVSFFNEILYFENALVSEAYISESLNILVPLLCNYSSSGIPPSKTRDLISLLNSIKEFSATQKQKYEIENNIKRIETELSILDSVLLGENNITDWGRETYFPLIERTSLKNIQIGSIDTFSIIFETNTNIGKDEFLVVPSLPELDKKFEDQLYNSWKYAKNYISNLTKKTIPNFKVVLQFNQKLGIYEGDSLGIALTLSFIFELAEYYNLRQSFKINNLVLSTGMVDQNGQVKELSHKIIEQKTKIAFYSFFNIFIVPSKDFITASKVFEEERKKHPHRNLQIVPADNIDDLINKSDIIKIKVQSLIELMIKKIRNHKILMVSVCLLFISIIWIGYHDNNNQKNDLHNDDSTKFLNYITAEDSFKLDKLSQIKDQNEILYMSFDKDKFTAVNKSHNIIFNNIQPTENRFMEKDKAYYFNGFNSFIELKNDNLLKPSLPISISTWFKKTDNEQGWLFSNSNDNSRYYGVFLGFGDGNLLSLHYGNGGKIGNYNSRRSIYSIDPINLSRWYHVVAEINSFDDMKIYLNNKLLNTVYFGEASELVYNDGNISFGMKKNWIEKFPMHFKGIIDDFRLYDHPLAKEKIEKLFHEK